MNPEINQPGLTELREAVVNRTWRRLPGRAALRRDGLAGLNGAISNVPDGMANAILVGVNPLYGLYATMVGPLVGGIVSSTSLMVITTTAAASLTAGQALAEFPAEARENALFVMVILVGVFQLLFGGLRLGGLTRFVSYSVSTGFLAGIAVLLILSQLPNVTGYAVSGANRITQTLSLIAHFSDVNLPSVAVAAFTLGLALTLSRTRVGNLSRIAAIILPSALVAFAGFDEVRIVHDIGDIPGAIPVPDMPLFRSAFAVLTGALSIAAITLVQGVGVSQSVPNPDGSRTRISRDFVAQGAANVASGFFRGLPVGGSLSTTAVNVISGAVTRWSAIFAGLWMALIIILAPGLVEYIAVPALGAMLILAGLRSIKPTDVFTVWNAGWPSRLAGTTTFLATLLLPIQAAVGLGVVLSALLYVGRSSIDVVLIQLVKRPDGRIEEHEPPLDLPSDKVTVLDVYGHLFYAGARKLEHLLPTPGDADHPAVVLRLRGHTSLGATVIEVLSNYARELRKVHGRLYLTGLSEEAFRQVTNEGKLRLGETVRVGKATAVRGESTEEAEAEANAWLLQRHGRAPRGDQPSDRAP
jgi:SulP family sulfate permease